MCRPATCRVCGKTTWAGCGQHVDQVMSSVPRPERCPGHSEAEQAAARPASGGGLLGRLFNR